MKSAMTPLGLWQYFPESGMNVLDTDLRGERWHPLIVSIAVTGHCLKGCKFCYASATQTGTSNWTYSELVDFIVDLDRNGVFSVTLGGGEPIVWEDLKSGKTFYDLISELNERVSLTLTFTTSGVPKLKSNQIPPKIPVRLSCHQPNEANRVLRIATDLRQHIDKVGINLLLWRSQLPQCRDAVHKFLASGFDDILLLTMQPAGFGIAFAYESLCEHETASFLKSLSLNSLRLTACQKPPRLFAGADMGCGANDWFISITEHKRVKSCSFVSNGHPLEEPTYTALLKATENLPRLPCYRAFTESEVARFAGLSATPHHLSKAR
jgi:hypothetical protein